ncbi:MAG: class I tRNA ligase family protein, partial [Egibacteraceae bacterium]
WYLELAKLREDAAAKQVLVHVLDVVLRLLHPIAPFVTEEVWRTLARAGQDETIMRAAWPGPDPRRRDQEAEAHMGAVVEIVTELRRFRADHGLPPSARIDVVAATAAARRPVLEVGLDGIRRLAGVEAWSFAEQASAAGPVATVVVTGAELHIPLAGLLDLGEERERLERELAKARAEVARAEGKLGNERFVDKAPAQVVQSERDKVAEWQATAATLAAQLEALT